MVVGFAGGDGILGSWVVRGEGDHGNDGLELGVEIVW